MLVCLLNKSSVMVNQLAVLVAVWV